MADYTQTSNIYHAAIPSHRRAKHDTAQLFWGSSCSVCRLARRPDLMPRPLYLQCPPLVKGTSGSRAQDYDEADLTNIGLSKAHVANDQLHGPGIVSKRPTPTRTI